MSKIYEDRCWTKEELANWLGIPVSTVAEKARTRAWPSLLAGALRFGPEERREIIAILRREAKAAPVSTEKTSTTPNVAPRHLAPVRTAKADNSTPLVARQAQRRKRSTA